MSLYLQSKSQPKPKPHLADGVKPDADTIEAEVIDPRYEAHGGVNFGQLGVGGPGHINRSTLLGR